MTYADINKMFTAEVSKYLARGYHFNAASMSGSQGETAKVDLTNGTEIIRVLLRTFSDGWDKQGTELFVGRVAEKENVRRDVAYCVNTIWNNRLEPVSSQRFYEVNGYGDSNKFYGTEADAEAVSKVLGYTKGCTQETHPAAPQGCIFQVHPESPAGWQAKVGRTAG